MGMQLDQLSSTCSWTVCSPAPKAKWTDSNSCTQFSSTIVMQLVGLRQWYDKETPRERIFFYFIVFGCWVWKHKVRMSCGSKAVCITKPNATDYMLKADQKLSLTTSFLHHWLNSDAAVGDRRPKCRWLGRDRIHYHEPRVWRSLLKEKGNNRRKRLQIIKL